jgi:hypothetical protein
MRSVPRYSALYLGVLACLAGWIAWRHGGAILEMANPEDGQVTGQTYTSEYFDLRYPLPPGWVEAEGGPPPSQSGYYVLSTLIPKGELAGTLLIAAQDMFFAANSLADAVAMASDLRRAMANVDGMTIDREPSEMRVADRVLHRVDFSGVGIYRAVFAIDVRCHVVTFNLATRAPDVLASLALSLNNLSSAKGRGAGPAVPPCMKNYAVPENVLRKVEPDAVGPKFTPIPVRIIIDADGGVKHIHVIRANAEQRRSIEAALRQWKFTPYRQGGQVVEIETGLVFEFKSAAMPSGRL